MGNKWGTLGEFELKSGTRDGDRTRTPCGKQILSLLRLPFRHPGTEKRVHLLKDSCTL